jgi:hypothetical protein
VFGLQIQTNLSAQTKMRVTIDLKWNTTSTANMIAFYQRALLVASVTRCTDCMGIVNAQASGSGMILIARQQ